MTGAFIGACMGGLVRSRDAYLYFIENNQATIFKSTFEAKVRPCTYLNKIFLKLKYLSKKCLHRQTVTR